MMIVFDFVSVIFKKKISTIINNNSNMNNNTNTNDNNKNNNNF